MILNDQNSLDPRAGLDEIEDEEDDATYPTDLMDDIMMSEQGSDPEGRASNGEEVLDFPESDHDEVHALDMRDMDMDPDDVVPDAAVPDAVVPDVVVPDLPAERRTRPKAKQVGV